MSGQPMATNATPPSEGQNMKQLQSNLNSVLLKQKGTGRALFQAPEGYADNSTKPPESSVTPQTNSLNASTPISDISNPIKRGVLMKKGGGKKKITSRANWKHREFVLVNSHSLHYYLDNKDHDKGNAPLGIIDIYGSKVSMADHITKKKFTFSITDNSGRTWLLQAASNHDRDSWLSTLTETCSSSISKSPKSPQIVSPKSSPKSTISSNRVDNTAASSKASLHSKGGLSKRRAPSRKRNRVRNVNPEASRIAKEDASKISVSSSSSKRKSKLKNSSSSRSKVQTKTKMGPGRVAAVFGFKKKMEQEGQFRFICANSVIPSNDKIRYSHPTHFTMSFKIKFSLGDCLKVIYDGIRQDDKSQIGQVDTTLRRAADSIMSIESLSSQESNVSLKNNRPQSNDSGNSTSSSEENSNSSVNVFSRLDEKSNDDLSDGSLTDNDHFSDVDNVSIPYDSFSSDDDTIGSDDDTIGSDGEIDDDSTVKPPNSKIDQIESQVAAFPAYNRRSVILDMASSVRSQTQTDDINVVFNILSEDLKLLEQYSE